MFSLKLIKRRFFKFDLKKILIFIFTLTFFFEVIIISHRVGFYSDNFFNFYKKNQGIEKVMIKGSVLHQIHEILNENNIKNYFLDKETLIKEIDYPFNNLFQRALEINYPIFFDSDSKYLITGSSYKTKCQLINKKKNISLYEC
jgi:hypothetical protein